MNAEELINVCNQIIDTKHQLDNDYTSMVNYEEDFIKKSCFSILNHLKSLDKEYKDLILKLMSEDEYSNTNQYFLFLNHEPGNHHIRIMLQAAYEIIFTIGIDNDGNIVLKVLDGRLGHIKGINEYSCDNNSCLLSFYSNYGEDKVNKKLEALLSSYNKDENKKWLNNLCNIANDYSLLENLTQTAIAEFAKDILEDSRNKNEEVTNRFCKEN